MTVLADTVAALRVARDMWRARQDEALDVASFPSRNAIATIVGMLAAALYPRRLGRFRGVAGDEEDGFVAAKLIAAFAELEREIAAELGYWQKEARADFPADQAITIVRLFGAALGEVRALIDGDVEAAFLADPAARSVDEILLCYPGAIASLHHRLAHQLRCNGILSGMSRVAPPARRFSRCSANRYAPPSAFVISGRVPTVSKAEITHARLMRRASGVESGASLFP